MSPNLGIPEGHRSAVVQLLNALLADEYLLYTKTRNYHWNVIGPQFHDLHVFFQQQYAQLDEVIDDVAERVRTLGGAALGTLAEFQKHSQLSEQPSVQPAAKDMVTNLLADHEKVVRQLREDVAACNNKFFDAGTSDFLTGLMEQHEKMAWMLRAFLETPRG
jgi:starvation-inducible DNA-binding protein